MPTATPTNNTIALGVTVPWDVTSRYNQVTAALGTAPKVMELYQDWAHQGFYQPNMDTIVAKGAMPVLSWEPEDYTQEPNPQPAYTYATITAGTYDTYIRTFARDSKKWGKTFYLKFAAEMNIDVYPWGVGAAESGNTTAGFVQMWRHVHDIFVAEGATNVVWVWCPNVIYADSELATLRAMYPGDSYVDWTGLDGYNWGAVRIGWQSFNEVFTKSYAALTSLTSKPIIICEVASAESGGNKATWITQGFLTDLPTKFPRIRAVIWFDEIVETDWRFDSSSSAAAAFRQVAQNPRFGGRLP